MLSTEHLAAILQPYQLRINSRLKDLINGLGGPKTLKEACSYALTNGGKRFRPSLVLMIANAIDPKREAVDAALSIECFHTASLIADDLPCMDDDDERRNKPSVHKVYGESTALLTSYALISEGYACLVRNIKLLKADTIGTLAFENVTYNTGIQGATGGQLYDLYPPDPSLETLLQIHQMKTSALFEIAFVLGWLFGGGDSKLLPEVKKASAHFGLAFQIADDFEDLEQDQLQGNFVNIALMKGKVEASTLFKSEIEALKVDLKKLNLFTKEIQSLIDLMCSKT